MKHLVLTTISLLALSLAQCGGGGSGGGPGGGTPHALEGTWLGALVDTGEISLRIDAAGVISDITTANPSPPLVLLGGTVDGGPDVFTFHMQTDSAGTVDCAFLTDASARHGTFAALGPTGGMAFLMFGVLERGATSRPTYFEAEILGDWSGYGYAYEPSAFGFAPFSPVAAKASDGTPDDFFEVTLPGGSFQGVLDGGLSAAGAWSGNVPATLARFVVAMSPDKLFVAVMAIPGTGTGVQDLSFYALNRD